MTDKALAVRGEMSLQDTMTLGETLAKSGFFSDARQAAQAVVKILAGRELGFGPIASMTGINVIQGKIAVGANLIAASIKRDPRYDYTVIRLDDDGCELAFYENEQEVGRSTFTMQNARETMYWNSKASKMEALASKFNWKSYPRNMCFARAMSNGAKWYCPDAGGGGPLYTPDELGAQVDGEGRLIEMPRQPALPHPSQSDPGHAADIAEARREIEDLDPLTPTDNQPDTPPTAARSWPGNTIKAIVDAGLAENPPQAVGMLNKSLVLVTTDGLDQVLAWANLYRPQRDGGKSPDEAAKWADEQIHKQAEAD